MRRGVPRRPAHVPTPRRSARAGIDAEGAAGAGAVKRAVPAAEYAQIRVAAAALAARALWFAPGAADGDSADEDSQPSDAVDLEPSLAHYLDGAGTAAPGAQGAEPAVSAIGEPAASPVVRLTAYRALCVPRTLHLTPQALARGLWAPESDCQLLLHLNFAL